MWPWAVASDVARVLVCGFSLFIFPYSLLASRLLVAACPFSYTSVNFLIKVVAIAVLKPITGV